MDIDPFRVRPYRDVPSAKVHAGFYDWYVRGRSVKESRRRRALKKLIIALPPASYESVAPVLRAAVQRLVSEGNITAVICTGHSLGAAMAGLCALDMRLMLGPSVRRIEFGAPMLMLPLPSL